MEYPFFRDFIESKISDEVFHENIDSFSKELIQRGLTDHELDLLKRLSRPASKQQASPEDIEEGKGLLARYGYPEHAMAANMLKKHPEDAVKIHTAAEEFDRYSKFVFRSGFKCVPFRITEENWTEALDYVCRFVHAAGEDTNWILDGDGWDWLGALNEGGSEYIFEYIEACDGDVYGITDGGLRYIEQIISINKNPWMRPGIVRLVKVSGPGAVNLLRYTLPSLKRFINEKEWPLLVEKLSRFCEGVGDKKTLADIVSSVFPIFVPWITLENMDSVLKEVERFADSLKGKAGDYFSCISKFSSLLGEHDWVSKLSDLKKLADATGKDSEYAFTCLSKIHNIVNDETWPVIMHGLPKLVNAAGKSSPDWAEFMVKMDDKNTQVTLKVLFDTLPGLSAKCVAGGHKSVVYFLEYLKLEELRFGVDEWSEIVRGLGEVVDREKKGEMLAIDRFMRTESAEIKTIDDFNILKECALLVLANCKGVEERTFHSMCQYMGHNLKKDLTMGFLRLLAIPVLKSHKVASFIFLESIRHIAEEKGVDDEIDIRFLAYIATKFGTRANTIMEDILCKGLKSGKISAPVSKEEILLKEFLARTPAYILELYCMFREAHQTKSGEELEHAISLMFKDVAELKDDLFSGELRREYDKDVFYSTLYFVFACPDVTVPKENYLRVYDSREDRQSDIPARFQRPLTVKLSKGGFMLKEGSGPVDTEAWDILVRIVTKIGDKKPFDIAGFGFQLLDAYLDDTLKTHREHYLSWIYQHSVNNGESLPHFNLEHSTLMKYKEFIGDRVKNDLIYSIFKESLAKDPARFIQLQSRILGRTLNISGLAKELSKIVSAKMDPEKKEEVIGKVLRRSGYHIEDVSLLESMDAETIKEWLAEQKPNVVEKATIAKVFGMIFGEEYGRMQEEIQKYEFKRSVKGKMKKYIFLLSKRKLHCVAAYNMGVCVAPDDKLWNKKDFWTLIIFDKEHNAHGGAILRTIEEHGKKYLVVSIQPASSILNEVSPVQVFDKIIQFCRVIAKKLKYENVIIPLNSAIHSNRGSIQSIIAERFKDKATKTLDEEYDFSYSPYHYSYQEFYIAW
ncbi:MAG: hypothetical protein V1729_05205 [Candidatus Woesearchaeota archaeon]